MELLSLSCNGQCIRIYYILCMYNVPTYYSFPSVYCNNLYVQFVHSCTRFYSVARVMCMYNISTYRILLIYYNNDDDNNSNNNITNTTNNNTI